MKEWVMKAIYQHLKSNGLKSSELKLVESVIAENQEVIAEHWNKFFNK